MSHTIEHAVIVRATQERAFDAFADGAGWDAWFTSGTTIDRDGGEVRLRWKDWGPDGITVEDGGRLIAYEPPRRLAFEWQPDAEGAPTVVEISVEPHPEGSVVRVRDSGYSDSVSGRAAFADCATGWGEALTLAKFWIEHGIRY